MLTIECDWPWEASPRATAIEMVGDIEAAVAFGLVGSERDLCEITAMICSGLPDSEPCKAAWSVTGRNALCLEVENEVAKFRQTFIRQEGGMVAEQDLLVLDGKYHRQGHAKRLIKNLLILYDRLQIIYASTYANHGNGGYTWAIFGARPIDPELQRKQLKNLAIAAKRAGTLDESYLDEVLAIIRDSSDDELMESVAELSGDDGTEIGKLLLVFHSWEAYWDLSCPNFRARIREVLQ